MNDPREDACNWLDREHREDVRHYSKNILYTALLMIFFIVMSSIGLAYGLMLLLWR